MVVEEAMLPPFMCHLNLKSEQFLFNLNLKSEHLKYCSLGSKTEVQGYGSGAQKIY